MGPAYRLFYDKPVQLVRGEGVLLYDADGREYLDCYNNVASVGHCHPRVVSALAGQAATLNTHTRYLHENVVRYAERLAASLPGELQVCTFVCTGTEANDLAYRMASTVTGHKGAIVTGQAYHGNSSTVAALSTSDYPARDRPEWLQVVEAPDGYRGSCTYGRPGFGRHYAGFIDEAVRALEKRDQQLAMFICDTVYSSNGILTPPPEYLQETFSRVRSAGALVVADEVQAGLCRLGDHTWGFEDSDVVPDIVTMGKPLGDGHPLAAVVTTPEIAEAFARRHDYFNTFGGNPVSAAVGLAVLDVIEEENLLQNVNATGNHLRAGLEELKARYEVIGDVRGKGLFYGVELVSDRDTRAPAPDQAVRAREFLRNHGILLSVTGPHGNVLKIRPPLVFAKQHAERLLEGLEVALKCRA
jgi:4-aminobutyrate aminotransferase-like enzyme